MHELDEEGKWDKEEDRKKRRGVVGRMEEKQDFMARMHYLVD